MFIWQKITRHLNFNWQLKSYWLVKLTIVILLNHHCTLFSFRNCWEKPQSMPVSSTLPPPSRSIRWWCPGPGTGACVRVSRGSPAMWGRWPRLTSLWVRAILSLVPTHGPWTIEDVGSGACWSICQYPSLCQPPWILMSEVGIVNSLKRLVMIIRAK